MNARLSDGTPPVKVGVDARRPDSTLRAELRSPAPTVRKQDPYIECNRDDHYGSRAGEIKRPRLASPVPDIPFLMLPQAVLERRDITASTKLVYAAIRDRIGSNEWAWPGIRWLAKRTGLTPQTVLRAIEALERRGLLVVQRRGSCRTNLYSLPGRSPTVAEKPQALTESQRSRNGAPSVQEIAAPALPFFEQIQNHHSEQERKKPLERDAQTKPRWTRELPCRPEDPARTVHLLASIGEEVREEPFSPAWPRDGKAIKPHLHLGEEEIVRRWRSFLTKAESDPFLASNLTITFFASRINVNWEITSRNQGRVSRKESTRGKYKEVKHTRIAADNRDVA